MNYIYEYNIFAYVCICMCVCVCVCVYAEKQAKELNKTSQKEEIQGRDEHLKSYSTNHQGNAN